MRKEQELFKIVKCSLSVNSALICKYSQKRVLDNTEIQENEYLTLLENCFRIHKSSVFILAEKLAVASKHICLISYLTIPAAQILLKHWSGVCF